MMPVFLPRNSVSVSLFVTQAGEDEPVFTPAYNGLAPGNILLQRDDVGVYICILPDHRFASMAVYSGSCYDAVNDVLYGINNVVGPNADRFRITTSRLDGTSVDGQMNQHYVHLVFFGVTAAV